MAGTCNAGEGSHAQKVDLDMPRRLARENGLQERKGGAAKLDRWIFLPAAVVIAGVVVFGFGHTYFFRPFLAPADNLTLLVHVHGALMTAWITLFVTQCALVTAGRTDLHRRLGVVGAVLVALILIVGVPTTIVAARLGGHHVPGPPLPALVIVLAGLFQFVILATLGILLRRRSDVHKRLMLLATTPMTLAAVFRLPFDFLDSFFRIYAANDALILVIIAWDSIRHRRLHAAFLWGSVFVVCFQRLSFWISDTNTWLRIANELLHASS